MCIYDFEGNDKMQSKIKIKKNLRNAVIKLKKVYSNFVCFLKKRECKYLICFNCSYL